MGGFDALVAQFDPVDTNRKGRQFERVCKWFLENDPTYTPLLRRVWLWNDWPDRKSIDAGIDLVAEDYDGKLWAIQAKAYNPASSISKADINSFISESSRAHFTHRMLIGTTDKRHHLATRLMDDLGIPFIGLTRLRKADDYLDWPATPDALRPAKPLKPMKPRDYQQPAIRKVIKGFETADRGQLIMACGTGKTLTAWFIREKLAAERTLVLVPSLSLLKQTLTEWRLANPKKPFAVLPVCSDETVGSLGEDAAVSHTSDLGVPDVTTDPVKIAEFLRKRSGPRVVFSTYHSSPQIAKAFTLGRVPAFDLVIADEAHRVAGPVSSDFATVLDPTAIRAKRRLFMTATPRIYSAPARKAGKDEKFEIASMDDHTVFGEEFHRLSFGEAIDRKILSDYQVAIIGVDDATYLDWLERGALITLDGKRIDDIRSVAGQIGLAKAMKKFDLRRTITFHSRVKAAKDFSTSMQTVLDWMPARHRPKGRLWSKYVSGEMSAGDRDVLLQHLKRLDDGERGLLANARCLSEGVDVPALDGVAFIDPRRSKVDIVQAVGRAIRTSDAKTLGTIVIPVFIDTDADAEVALKSSVFDPVWDVVNALRAHDTVLGEQLDELRREMGRKSGKPRLPSKIHVDVPASVGRDFTDALKVKVVNTTTTSWEFWYGLLQKYVSENKTAWVKGNELYDGHRLGQWVVVQRNKWETLSDDRRSRLLAIPGWITDVREMQWEEGFSHLEQYVSEYGDAWVHDEFQSPDGYRLGKWVGKQRTKWEKLTGEQRRRLEDLNGWTTDAAATRWEQGYRLLQQYAAENNDANPPSNYEVDGFKLGIWVRTQRSLWDKIPEERQKRLREIDTWMVDLLAEKWDRACRLLEAYTAEHGTSFVKQSLVIEGFPLGRWVSKQRDRWDLLADQQRSRLKDLPGWTLDARGVWWEKAFKHLQDYVAEHQTISSLRGTQTYNGYELGRWVTNQKIRWNTLGEERQQRLQKIPGWTLNTTDARWEEGFQHLQAFANVHKTSRLPSSQYIHEGFKLGIWVNTQRQNWAKLSKERQKRLLSLPDWTVNTREALWDESYGYLVRYLQVHGDADVPSGFVFEGFRLGQWVTVQRRMHKTGQLKPDREAKLKELHGWIWQAPRGFGARRR